MHHTAPACPDVARARFAQASVPARPPFGPLLLALAALCALLLAGCRPAAPAQPGAEAFRGVDLSRRGSERQFQLEDADGIPRTLADYRGKVVLLFFGFTRCPDICPMSLVRAKQIKETLGESARDLEVLFISLDHEHDGAALLKTYVDAFDPGFVGLRGSREQVDAAVASFDAVYMKVDMGAGYSIDHSTWTYLIDRDGKLRVGLRHTQPLEDFVADVGHLLAAPRAVPAVTEEG